MVALDVTAIRRLVERAGDRRVLSLYLPVDPTDPENRRTPPTQKWQVRMRNQLRELEGRLPDDRDERMRWQSLTDRADAWLRDYTPAGRTLVLVVDEDDVTDIELPVVLQQDAGYGPPLVAGLLRALSDHRFYAVFLVDRQTVRAVTGHLGFDLDTALLELHDPWGMPGATRSAHQFRFDARREEYQGRYHADVAEQVDRFLLEHHDVERLVIGGEAGEAHGVARALSHRSHELLVGVIPMRLDTPDSDIVERVSPHAEAFEEEQDLEQVAALGAARASGRGVVGAEPVIGALEQFLARDVLVSSRFGDDDVLEEAARHTVLSGARLRFVHRAAADALDGDGGVGARLYYAVPTGSLPTEG
jgi:hypothetical protein